MHHVPNEIGIDPVPFADLCNTIQDTNGWVLGRRWDLRGTGLPVRIVDQEQVGKGSADVNAESILGGFDVGHVLLLPSVVFVDDSDY